MDSVRSTLFPAVVLPRRQISVLVEIGSELIDQRHRLLELKGGKIPRSGIGFRDVKAVIGHVDRCPVLPAVRLENIELPPGNSRIIFSFRLETNFTQLIQGDRRSRDHVLVYGGSFGENSK